MIIFTPQIIILAITGLINLAMSVFVFSRGIKNKVNLYFSIITFFNFLWSAGLIVVDAGINYELTRFSAAFIYPVAFIIVVGLFYFSVHFPYKVFEVKKVYKYIINFFVAFFSIYCIFAYKIFVLNVSLRPKAMIYYEPLAYGLYSLLLIAIMLAALYIFFIKYKSAEGIFRSQLILILIASIVGTAAGTFFNLFYMYTYNLDYNHLGPLFTLFINFVVFGFIISPKEKISN